MYQSIEVKKLLGCAAAIMVCVYILSCTSKDQKDYSSIKGKLAIHFKGKKASYTWDFQRLINHKLTLLQKVEFSKGPLLNIQYNKNALIGLNFRNSKLFFFDSTLRNFSSFGQKGRMMPLYNDGIFHFEYLGNQLFLFDFGSRAVKKYNLNDGSLVYSNPIKDPTGVYRVGHLANNNYIYTKPRDSIQDMDFIIFDSSGNNEKTKYSLNELLNITEKENYPGMAYDGNFVSDNQGNYIVYYCSFTGLFFCFDKNENAFKFFSRTIDRTPVPKAAYVPISPKHKSLDVIPNVLFFPSASVSYNRLYLLNTINKDSDYIVDTYDLKKKGAYTGSFFVPRNEHGEKPISIATNADKMYVLYEDQSILKYAIDPH